jgi:outer membrane cobalamin receptor
MFGRFFHGLLVCLLLVLSAHEAWAQVQTLAPIEITGPPDDFGLTGAASEGEVSKQRLDARPAYRPGELLEAMPGLIVSQHSGEGKANQYFLRGFNLDHGTDLAITSTACRSTCARMGTRKAMPIPVS